MNDDDEPALEGYTIDTGPPGPEAAIAWAMLLIFTVLGFMWLIGAI